MISGVSLLVGKFWVVLPLDVHKNKVSYTRKIRGRAVTPMGEGYDSPWSASEVSLMNRLRTEPQLQHAELPATGSYLGVNTRSIMPCLLAVSPLQHPPNAH